MFRVPIMFRLIRYFLPRRKENVLNFGLFILVVAFCVLMTTQLNIVGQIDTLLRRSAGGDSHNHHDDEVHHKKSGVEKRSVDNDNFIGDDDENPRKHVIPDYSKSRSGPGENGAAVLLKGEEEKRGKDQMKVWFMNVVASDKISHDRSIPDTRIPECKTIKYDDDLPDASVVIIFHNEAWSPLIRTVHSVYNRTPMKLLHEIVLLDDASDRGILYLSLICQQTKLKFVLYLYLFLEELGIKLENYIKKFGKKVKLVRKAERQGLIRARLEGAKAASGKVVVFLDSHCEANVGW